MLLVFLQVHTHVRVTILLMYLSRGLSDQRRGELLSAGSSRVEDVELVGAVTVHHGVSERQRVRHVSAEVLRLKNKD